MRKNYKPLIMAVLCALIVVMAIGFALLSQELNITGTSHIDSNWNIRITNIRVKNLNSGYASGDNASSDVSGNTGCTTKTAPCNATEANFEAKLVTPGDYIVYEVTITNSGTLDGVVASINLSCSENDNITCTTTGLARGDTIAKTNGTNTVDVKVEYNSDTSSQPVNTSTTATLIINYQQDLGQLTPTYTAYSVGDTIQYKGSNWRVIKNAAASDTYVTLMKETVLTAQEIGNNYSFKQYCTYEMSESGNCTVYETFTVDEMAYYWSNTCHRQQSIGTYGSDTYDSNDFSGCSGHNDYAGSKIKEVVDNYMLTNNMTNDLIEVNEYKIRLITKDELMNDLGFEEYIEGSNSGIRSGSSTEAWVYNAIYSTMTPNADSTSSVWRVGSDGKMGYDNVYSTSGVRPVINLLKSAIPAQS